MKLDQLSALKLNLENIRKLDVAMQKVLDYFDMPQSKKGGKITAKMKLN